jgi:hypothetical protein
LKYSLWFVVIAIPLVITFTSCSDDPSSIGIDLLAGDFVIVSSFDTKDDSVFQSSSYFKEVVPLGLASRLLIGKRENIEATALMDFAFFINDSLEQDFLDGNITVNQATLELTPIYTYTDEMADFDFTVHKINSKWFPSDFTSDSLINLSYDAEDLSSNKNFTDSLYTFQLDNDFVLSWIKFTIDSSLEDINGIYYKPTMNSNKVVGFQALTTTSSTAAKLKIVIEKQGSFIDTIQPFIFSDVSAVVADIPVLPVESIALQSSITIQAKLFFDVSKVPRDVIINKAELILTADTLNSITGSSFNGNLLVYRVTDSSDVSVDEDNGIELKKDNDIYTGDVTSFITSWIINDNNEGMIIRPGSITEGLELFAIKGTEYPDSSMRPRLRIVFTSREN